MLPNSLGNLALFSNHTWSLSYKLIKNYFYYIFSIYKIKIWGVILKSRRVEHIINNFTVLYYVLNKCCGIME